MPCFLKKKKRVPPRPQGYVCYFIQHAPSVPRGGGLQPLACHAQLQCGRSQAKAAVAWAGSEGRGCKAAPSNLPNIDSMALSDKRRAHLNPEFEISTADALNDDYSQDTATRLQLIANSVVPKMSGVVVNMLTYSTRPFVSEMLPAADVSVSVSKIRIMNIALTVTITITFSIIFWLPATTVSVSISNIIVISIALTTTITIAISIVLLLPVVTVAVSASKRIIIINIAYHQYHHNHIIGLSLSIPHGQVVIRTSASEVVAGVAPHETLFV